MDIDKEALIEHLTAEHGYDFIHEVLSVRHVDSDEALGSLQVDYRGIHGEYGTVYLDVSLGDLLDQL
jgi:hypothetical protein